MAIAIIAARAFTPFAEIEHPVLVVEDGAIRACGAREAVTIPPGATVHDLGAAILAPGFLDLHVHGGAGHDVMEASGSAMAAFETHLARHGVTGYCPTTVTAPVEATLAALATIGQAVKTSAPGRAQPLGLHLEGPFISTAKCGVHPVADIQPPSVALFEKLHTASGGTVRLMTVAPELPGAAELIVAARHAGIKISLGHSAAATDATQSAIKAGATHATHTFNAMRALDHRDPGILGAALSDDRLSADIIVDGVHVAPELVKMFLRAKGEERAVLITDGISATGMPDGRYRLGTLDVEVRDGACRLHGKLAGSVLTMDRAIRNTAQYSGWPLRRVIRLATANPAAVLELGSKGALAAGQDADIVALDASGAVLATYCRGMRVHQ